MKDYLDELLEICMYSDRSKVKQAVTEALERYTRNLRAYENETRDLLCDDPRDDIEFVNIFLEGK